MVARPARVAGLSETPRRTLLLVAFLVDWPEHVSLTMSLIPSHVTVDADQAALVQAAREFAEAELLELDRRCDHEGTTVIQMLPKLGEMGLLNLLLPEDVGGLGVPYTTYASILHDIAVFSPSTCVTISVHTMVGQVLNKYLPEPCRTEWLSEWASTDSFAAFCLSEAGSGSDAASVTTTAVKVDGGYRVTGEKMWITNGMSARWFLVLVRLEGASTGEHLCALLVDGNDSGIERAEIHGKMGIRGSETAVINLTNVLVPDDHLVGRQGAGLEVFLSCLDGGRVGIASQATGMAEACLSEMVSYARQREQFGRPIGSFQGVAGAVADSAMELEAAKLLVWRAAQAIDQGKVDRTASSMAKLYASEAVNRIAYRAVQIHGGAGYVHECRVEQLYRDARVTTIYEGTSEIQRIVIARGLAQA